MKRSMIAVVGVVAVMLAASAVHAVVIETVPVGNPGNAGEVQPQGTFGAVDYAYQIGMYEVTAGQYCEFLNAVAKTDTNTLYRTGMDSSSQGCQITRIGSSGTYTYDFSGRPSGLESDWVNRPVNYVSWYDAARFANWLTTGNTETGVYVFSGGTLQSILDHQVAQTTYGTAYFIPTENEWYKAAYYDPDKGGPGVAGYWDYPTKSDAMPSNDLANPDPGNNATYEDGSYTIGIPYYRTEVGAHENSESAYGTFDQGGNVFEWNETVVGTSRGWRGGAFTTDSGLVASQRGYGITGATSEFTYAGFRVAAIPEPATMALMALGGVGTLLRRRRRGYGG